MFKVLGIYNFGMYNVHKKSPDAYEFSNLNGLLVIVMAILKSISFSDCALLNWQKNVIAFHNICMHRDEPPVRS